MKNSLENARLEINRIDSEMARLFEERMKCAETIAKYKKDNGMPIFDPEREAELIERNSQFIENDSLRGDYVKFLSGVMAVSKGYQKRVIVGEGSKDSCATVIPVSFGERSYNIHIEKNSLGKAVEIFGIKEKCAFIITDEGVPRQYAEAVARGFDRSYIYRVKVGEDSKSLRVFSEICAKMLELGFDRSDVVISVGGGVVGDLGGFVAASYMRGIDFYNIPTTLLSMVDSSIGGKTAVNHEGIKNIIGAFYQPKGVLIDVGTLDTLQRRHISAGLAESIKMAATFDKELFLLLETGESLDEILERVIIRSVEIKRSVVEADEREGGMRKILNFGHTFGHAVEAATNMGELYHGECVAIGMMAVSSSEVRDRLFSALKKYGLPTEYMGDIDEALSLIKSDKKRSGNMIDAVFAPEIGRAEIRKIGIDDFSDIVRKNLGGKI